MPAPEISEQEIQEVLKRYEAAKSGAQPQGVPTNTMTELIGQAGTVGAGAGPSKSPMAEELPVHQQALMGMRQMINPLEEDRVILEKYETRPGVPLDLESGANWLTRMQVARRDSAEVDSYLKEQFGYDKVRQDVLGGWIVTQTDDKGNEVDVRINPPGFDPGDIPQEIAAYLPEMLAGGAAMAGARKMVPFEELGKINLRGTMGAKAAKRLGMLRDITSFAVGAGIGRGLEQAQLDIGRTGAVNVDKVAREMAVESATQEAFGLGTWVGGKMFFRAGSLFGREIPKLNLDAVEAQKFFAETFDPRFANTLLPAERTGSTILAKRQAYSSAYPGGGRAKTRKQERLEDVVDIQDTIAGMGPDPVWGNNGPWIRQLHAVEDMANRATTAIEEQYAQEARREVLGKATEAIDDVTLRMLQSVTPPTAAARAGTAAQLSERILQEAVVRPEAAATAILNKAVAKEQLKDQEIKTAYDAVKAALGKSDWPLEIGSAPQLAQNIINKLPKKKDAQGNVTLLTKFINPTLLKDLKDVASWVPGEKTTFDSLKRIRVNIDDQIRMLQKRGGRDVELWTELREVMSTQMKESIAPYPNALPLYDAAETMYREHARLLEKPGMDQITGYKLDPNRFMNSFRAVANPEPKAATEGKTVYDAAKEYFGDTSNEFKLLQQAVRDDILRDSRRGFTSSLDANKFFDRLAAFNNNNPGVAAEVFPNLAALGKDANTLLQISKLKGGNIDPDKALLLLTQEGKEIHVGDFRELVNLAKERDKQLVGGILAKFRSGKLVAGDINAAELAPKLVETTPPKVLIKLMEKIESFSPGLADEMRMHAAYDLLQKSSKNYGQVMRDFVPVSAASYSELAPNLAKHRTAYTAMFGPEKMKQIDMFAKMLRAMEQEEKFAGMAGGLAGGKVGGELMGNTNIFRKLASAGHITANFIYANLFAYRWMENLLSNSVFTKATTDPLLAYIAMSGPMVREMMDNFTEEGAHLFAENLNRAFSRPNEPAQSPSQP